MVVVQGWWGLEVVGGQGGGCYDVIMASCLN